MIKNVCFRTCGNCSECRRGMPNFCLEGGMKYTIGISVNGGWAEYCKVRTSLVFKIHDSVTFEQGINYSSIIISSKHQNINYNQ